MAHSLNDPMREVAAYFDGRAERYDEVDWHARYALRLIECADPRPGDMVVDAATGTGHAALIAARRVGDAGRVIGVDISPEMVAHAIRKAQALELQNVAFRVGDAVELPDLVRESVDAIVCSSAIVYLPVERALRAWREVLPPGGRVAFSTMQVGSPPVGALFRECIEAVGCVCPDPNAVVGTPARSRDLLKSAGYQQVEITTGSMSVPVGDVESAWEANLAAPFSEQARRLETEQLGRARRRFEERFETLAEPDRAEVLYAVGRT
jgi:ubiquinone/menaquinone biosynthesis C-methylase UbiE